VPTSPRKLFVGTILGTFCLPHDPIVHARLQEAVRLRQAEREFERDMLPEARAAFNRAKRKERARAFGALFYWKISVAGFPSTRSRPATRLPVAGAAAARRFATATPVLTTPNTIEKADVPWRSLDSLMLPH
jgi:hypothetical protein